MPSVLSRARVCAAIASVLVPLPIPAAPARAADDVLARVRERGSVRCASIVRPGIAVPTVDGARWYGIAPDVCRAVAAAVLGQPEKMSFRPYLVANDRGTQAGDPDDIVFLASEDTLSSRDAHSSVVLGPVVVHDGIGILVHAAGAKDVPALGSRSICVEPGTQTDRALTRYFAARAMPLHEHPFQESDEMRQAFETGNCDGLAGPLSTLASVRADPSEGHPTDRILGDLIADDPIFAATPNDARWSRIVWWTFSALVDAEDAGISGRAVTSGTTVPGVPPAVGTTLGLATTWTRDALAASGNYGEMFERDLGAASRFRLARGANALSTNSGLIDGLRVE